MVDILHDGPPWFAEKIENGTAIKNKDNDIICIVPDTSYQNVKVLLACPEMFEILRNAPMPVEPEVNHLVLKMLSDFLGLYETWFFGMRQYVIVKAVRGM